MLKWETEEKLSLETKFAVLQKPSYHDWIAK